MTRRFVDAPQDCRCTATITLRDKSTAQCGRKATEGDLCTQHARIEDRRVLARVDAHIKAEVEGMARMRKAWTQREG